MSILITIISPPLSTVPSTYGELDRVWLETRGASSSDPQKSPQTTFESASAPRLTARRGQVQAFKPACVPSEELSDVLGSKCAVPCPKVSWIPQVWGQPAWGTSLACRNLTWGSRTFLCCFTGLWRTSLGLVATTEAPSYHKSKNSWKTK